MSRGGFGRKIGIETLPERGFVNMDLKVVDKVSRVQFNKVFERIIVPKNPPQLLIVAGPCRVGSTALSNVFARAGLTSYMQPIKSIRREIEEGLDETEWNIGENEGIVLSKETFGAKSRSEYFDPVDTLIRAGYPSEKIHLIGIIREPKSTLTSWTWMWNEVSIDGFVKAYRDTYEMMLRSEKRGVGTTYYVHEAIRDNDPGLVVKNLFDRVLPGGLKLSSGNVVEWEKGPNFDQASEVMFFDRPPERFVHAVKTWGGYQYRDLIPELSREQENKLRSDGVKTIYNEFVEKCQEDLFIKINTKGAGFDPNLELEVKEEDKT